MLLLILSVLGHPAMLLFHALHWSVGGYPEAVVGEVLKGVLPESGRAHLEVALAGKAEWMAWSLPDGTFDASPRRMTELNDDSSGDIGTSFIVLAIVQWLIGLIITIVLTYLFASRYNTSITEKRVPWQGCPPGLGLQPTGGIWKYETCKCLDNCDYCMYGFCCTSCRVGDTYTMTSVGPSYMTYIHAYVAVEVIGQVVKLVVAIVWDALGLESSNAGELGNLGFYVANVFMAYWLAGQRAKLRQALGDPQPETHCAMDFLLYWCCSCCTAIQEGRQVDEITNTQTKCFLQLQPLHTAPPGMPPTVVGQPVGAPAAPVVGTVVADPKQQQQYGGANYGNVAT